jgi:hypothetical protein
MHSELFGPKTLRTLLDLCKVPTKDEYEEERVTLEWMYFGLFVFVESIQDNFPQSHNVGIAVAIARAFLSQFEFQLAKAGADLTKVQCELDGRIRRYESAGARGHERVGLDVAAMVFGQQTMPGDVPAGFEAYEFGLGANNARLAGRKAVNEFFQNYTIET